MWVSFTKMHGAGNDFVVFDAPAGTPWVQPEVFQRLADRHTGIGFDQALVLSAPRRAGTAAFYRVFNADGTEVEQCGNGARCVAALLGRRGADTAGTLMLDSPAGLIQARIEDGQVAVDMGIPCFEPRALPFDAPAFTDRYNIEAGGHPLVIGAVSIGNPHAVLTVESVEAAPVKELGPLLEAHPRFPRRVNVGFMQIIDRSAIRLRVYERGAGETSACGTGACAAVAVGRLRGQLDSDVRVSARGGELRVNWQGPGERIWLTGPAQVSFEGQVEIGS